MLVIGGGPAGSLTAFLAARSGLTTHLVDKAAFPRDKICGCTLNGHAVAALARAGLRSALEATRPIPIREFRLAHDSRSAFLPLEHHFAVSRRALDSSLLDAAARAGALVSVRTTATSTQVDADRVTVELEDDAGKRSTTARVVVAADGLSSRLLGAPAIADNSRIGGAHAFTITSDALPAAHPPGRLSMAVGGTGYVGVVRLEDGRVNVAAALDRSAARREGGVGRACARILESAGVDPIPGLAESVVAGTPALSRRVNVVARGRMFAVGDAAGYIEPFTGEGIGWAFESALALAPHLRRARDGDPMAASRYTAAIESGLRRRQRLCRAVAWTLRRIPLVDAAVTLLREFPLLASFVVARLDSAPSEVPA